MFGPLSLRLCSLATMAPALTETASQARVNLSPSPPESGLESRVSGKADYLVQTNGGVDYYKKQPSIESLSGKQLQNRNFFAAFTSTQFTQLSSLKNLPELFKAKPCKADGELVVSGRMSHSSTNGKMVSDIDSRAVKLSNGTMNRTDGSNVTEQSTTKDNDSNGVLKLEESLAEASQDGDCSLDSNGSAAPVSSAETIDSTVVSSDSLASPPVSSAELGRRQQTLDRRAGRLAKRIRRLQSVQSTSHVRSQLRGFVDSQHRNLESMATSISTPQSTADLQPDVLQSENIKSLSTAALVNLVRRLQSSQVTLRQRLQASSSSQLEGSSVLTLDEETASDVEQAAGKLRANLSHLEKCIDSDATESSSGGESCDEDEYSDTDSKYNPSLRKRAEWKWASSRSCVASRWTWLQAQVSDLEYRIRQQTEIYKQIRQSKGQVLLGEQPSPEDLMARLRPGKTGRKLSPIEAKISAIEKRNEMSPSCNISSLLHNVDKQSSRLTQSLGNCYSPISSAGGTQPASAKSTPPLPVLNGTLDSSHSSQSSTGSAAIDSENPLQKRVRREELSADGGATVATGNKNTLELSPPADSSCRAARCRPVRIYRKRRLLRTTGLHLVNRKAARLSTIKCHCYPPGTSCPMCGGRYNNVQHVDPFSMTTSDRIALLEPSYHPTLSFKQDIPLTVHFENLLKSGDWQAKPTLKTKSGAVSSEKKKNKVKADVNKLKKTKKNASGLLSKKFRQGLSRSHGSSLPGTPKNSASRETRLCRTDIKKKKKNKSSSLAQTIGKRPYRTSSVPSHMDRSFSTPSPSFRDTLTPPVAQSCPSALLKAELKAGTVKRRESAYDIDNIVIPYSMAASTRVEKLQYKEIVTPKWRDVTLTPEENHVNAQEDVKLPLVSTDQSEESLNDQSTQSMLVPDCKMEPALPEPVAVDNKDELSGKSPNGFVKIAVKEEPMDEGGDSEDEVEDLSEEAVSERHLKCEIQEKKRFLNFVTVTNKRGSRRTESGATTPDPMSPESSLNDSLFRSASVSSPTPPSTPAFSKDSSLIGRRRSSSLSRHANEVERLSVNEDSCASGIMFETPSAPPWPPRLFPLADDDYEDLFREKPIEQVTNMLLPPRAVTRLVTGGVTPSVPSSPMSTGSEVDDDDPNDPEWTCVTEEKSGQMPKIVLKLKR